MSHRRGRPASGEAADDRLEIRARPSELKRLEQVARLNGTTVSDFVREAVNGAAADCSDDPVFIVVK